jgi:uncharacterized membrane protein YkoI
MKFSHLAPVLACLSLVSAGVALAQSDSQEAKNPPRANAVLPLETIMQKSIELYPGGRVVEAELDDDFIRDTYEVEVIDINGVEWELEFDARTGEVLKRKQDND